MSRGKGRVTAIAGKTIHKVIVPRNISISGGTETLSVGMFKVAYKMSPEDAKKTRKLQGITFVYRGIDRKLAKQMRSNIKNAARRKDKNEKKSGGFKLNLGGK